MVVRKNVNLIEIVDNGYWILMSTEGVVVNDDETCEEVRRSDWMDYSWLEKYSREAASMALEFLR